MMRKFDDPSFTCPCLDRYFDQSYSNCFRNYLANLLIKPALNIAFIATDRKKRNASGVITQLIIDFCIIIMNAFAKIIFTT